MSLSYLPIYPKFHWSPFRRSCASTITMHAYKRYHRRHALVWIIVTYIILLLDRSPCFVGGDATIAVESHESDSVSDSITPTITDTSNDDNDDNNSINSEDHHADDGDNPKESTHHEHLTGKAFDAGAVAEDTTSTEVTTDAPRESDALRDAVSVKPVQIVLKAENEGEEATEPPIEVADYLETLSRAELQQICTERGFEIREGEDMLVAARRCLSLESEINALIAKNPELAAELEAEIDRMRVEKERLEVERSQLLEQITELRAQLEAEGLDTSGAGDLYKHLTTTYESSTSQVGNAGNMTFQEVFIESLVQLYERVSDDVRIVTKLLTPIGTSIYGVVEMAGRYLDPLVGDTIRSWGTKIVPFWKAHIQPLTSKAWSEIIKIPAVSKFYNQVVATVRRSRTRKQVAQRY